MARQLRIRMRFLKTILFPPRTVPAMTRRMTIGLRGPLTFWDLAGWCLDGLVHASVVASMWVIEIGMILEVFFERGVFMAGIA